MMAERYEISDGQIWPVSGTHDFMKYPLPDKERLVGWLADMRRSQADLARHLGISKAAVTNLFQGTRTVEIHEAAAMAAYFNVSMTDLLLAFRVTKPRVAEKIRIQGYVGADDAVILYQDHDTGEGYDEIESPFPGYSGVVVQIRGSSMRPRYKDGELVAYHPNGADIALMVGKECFAKLVDGRFVLKILQKGTEADCYTLVSVNPETPPIVNAKVEWVAAIDWHKP